MFASTTLSLILVNCAAGAQFDPADALCTADPQASIATHPAVSANLNLVQVGLSMQNKDSAPDGELIEFKKLGPKPMAGMNNEVLELLSENLKDLDQLLPMEESLHTAASLLAAADSTLTAASMEELPISNVTVQEQAVNPDPLEGFLAAVGGFFADYGFYVAVGGFLGLAYCFKASFLDEATTMDDATKRGRTRIAGVFELFRELSELAKARDLPSGRTSRANTSAKTSKASKSTLNAAEMSEEEACTRTRL